MASVELNPRKMLALALIVALVVFLIVALVPYLSGIFGAIILYVIFHPVFKWLTAKGLAKHWGALAIIALSIFIILIPLFVVLSLVLGEVPAVVAGAQNIIENLDGLNRLSTTLDVEAMAQEALTRTGTFVKELIVSGIGRATHTLIGLTIMYFVLYFMFVNNEALAKAVRAVVPFNRKNTDRLFKEASNVTYSVIISTGALALLQGLLLGMGLWAAGIPGAVLWGVIGAILSFLPVVGTPIVWLPAVGVLLVQGRFVAGGALLVWGVILSNVDNFLRPIIQKRVAEMHPLISVVGVFIGIPYFGLLGLIVGPLILSYLVLTVGMFREEYL